MGIRWHGSALFDNRLSDRPGERPVTRPHPRLLCRMFAGELRRLPVALTRRGGSHQGVRLSEALLGDPGDAANLRS